MSRSRKKAIIKDKPRNRNRASLYWSSVRSTINTAIRSCRNYEDLEIPDPKTIVNDYTYCDYIIDYEYCNLRSNWWTHHRVLAEEYVRKLRRK